MTEKKGTRSGEATPERAGMEKQLGAAAISTFNYSPHKAEGQGISSYLSHGAEHGVGLRDLVHLTGLPNRVVRQMIQMKRINGIPILSDNTSGYFLPNSNEEVGRCVASLRHRANEILKTASAIERGCGGAGVEGQIFFDEF